MPQPTQRDRRIVVFFLICVAMAVLLAAYLARRGAPEPEAPAAPAAAADAAALARVQQGAFLVFRNTDLGQMHGRVFVRPLHASGDRVATPLSCERVAYAAGHGVCLIAQRGAFGALYEAATFDSTFTRTHSFSLAGIPSRVRMSPSGRFAGITVFVAGDSYANDSMSTRATILDVATGTSLGTLEEFAMTRRGQPFKAVDFNYWGITFATDERAYATLQTGGRRYLVELNVPAKTGTVLYDDVECPAVSPDHTRVAFKRREMHGGRLSYRLCVLDLANGKRTPLAEARSVDDQAEWLDNGTVMYGLASEAHPGSTDVWTVPADGTGTPARLIEGGWSPGVATPTRNAESTRSAERGTRK